MKQVSLHLSKYIGRIVGFLLMVSGLHVYAGNLTASVDRDTLGLEETFTLTLRFDEQVNATPDYELLRKDFDILNTQSGTQMSIINGSMEASTEWKIALAPKRIGKALIPSFTIEGAISDAIEMTIEGKAKSPKNTDSKVTVEVETSKDTSYVQEQIIVTLRLYTTVGLNGIELQPMQVKDALVMQLDEKQYQTKINGRPGAVVETRYAVFPQQSGEIIIPSMLYQVSLASGQRDLWDRFYGNNQNNMLRLRTDEQRLNVLPAPTTAQGEWLPANNVSLSEHWSADITSLKIGEPITRSITIKADGLTAGQITPLQFGSIDGLTFYNDQAQNDDQKSANGVVGSRTETVAIVPTKAGHFTLPEVKVNWWDTKTNSLRTATLPAVHLTVDLGDMSQQPPAPTDTADIAPDLGNKAELNANLPQPAISEVKAPLWLYISNLMTLILALVFGLLLLKNKRAPAENHSSKQRDKNDSNLKESEAWNNFKRALSEKELAALRKALIAWAQAFWKDDTINTLQSVAAHAEDPALTEELRKLDEAMFSTHASAPDTDALLQLLANFRRNKNSSSASSEVLQPLYKA